MSEKKSDNPADRIYLGIDGGQSHTEAIIADERGNIIGGGFGGASNHAEVPGGRERLRQAIANSVGEALKNASLPPLNETVFASAHCGMTGGADYKTEIIGEIIKAEKLTVGHDAPTALCGATAGKPGIVVIAGTGSVVYGENQAGNAAQIGGLGFLFADEGSGFWLAAQTIRLAIKERDDLIADNDLQRLVLSFFGRETLREITSDYYNGKISRDEIASLAKAAATAAENGNRILREQICFGAAVLAASVRSAARRLEFDDKFPVAGIGGMFRGELMREYFRESLTEQSPNAVFTPPRLSPPVGALLLAYKQNGFPINETLLANLEKSQTNNE